jgi:hypothetical protein
VLRCDGQRQVADFSDRVVLDRDVFHVYPRRTDIGKESSQRSRRVRNGDDDFAVADRCCSVLAADLLCPSNATLS